MTNADRTVLITGATGRQGGAVVRHMLPKGWKLRALTRNPSSYAAKHLARQGVELAQGDLDDPASLERAVRGVYGVYSVQDFWTVGARREVQQGKNLADAGKKAGVEHFVYSSVGGAERRTGITHWETKWEVEKHIRGLKLPATVLRPASFMETYHILEVEIGLLKGKLADPIRGDKPYQTIATDDIGGFVAMAFERPKEFTGLELEIAGSELTNIEAAQAFSRVLNRPVKFQKLPMLAVKLFLGKEFYEMFHWFNTKGYQANIAELRRKFPDVRLHSLEEWLREDGWDKRGLRFKAPKD
ncbi:MAG TPA: NmrA/HSCARG family protein [Bryobacteraceae bacterium]|nr:NmrA/HSCARG family protein [Bryobacteraceae bacterium]